MHILIPLLSIAVLVLVYMKWPREPKVEKDTCVHDWNKWKDLDEQFTTAKGHVLTQTRTCKLCGKREERKV